MSERAAIFLDRDGTIIEDRGYIDSIHDVVFYPASFSALKKLQESFLLFIITNQSGIGKGLVAEDDVQVVNNYVVETLKKEGITIHDTFCCPHKTEDNCNCKKPSPYFIHRAAEKYDLSLPDSFIIGDHPSDVMCGVNAGITPVYLLSGHGRKHKDELTRKVKICENILEATDYIMNKR